MREIFVEPVYGQEVPLISDVPPGGEVAIVEPTLVITGVRLTIKPPVYINPDAFRQHVTDYLPGHNDPQVLGTVPELREDGPDKQRDESRTVVYDRLDRGQNYTYAADHLALLTTTFLEKMGVPSKVQDISTS